MRAAELSRRNILRVHNGGVVQTLLNAQGQRQGAVKVGDPDDRQHRHQLLAGHPGVVRLHLGYQQARGARRNGETRRRQQRSGLLPTSFLFAAPSSRQTARRVSASCRLNSSASKSCLLGSGGQRRRRRRSGTGDTGRVVIEGGAADDIFGGFDEIGGFINDARRIARQRRSLLPLFMPIATMRGRR